LDGGGCAEREDPSLPENEIADNMAITETPRESPNTGKNDCKTVKSGIEIVDD